MGAGNGHRWDQVRTQAFNRDRTRNAPCHLCRGTIDYQATPQTPDAWEPDHIKPRSTHPHLEYEPSNLAPAHSSCNRSRGNKAIQEPTSWTQAEIW